MSSKCFKILLIAYVLLLIGVSMAVMFDKSGKHTYKGQDPEYNKLSGFHTVAATDTAIR